MHSGQIIPLEIENAEWEPQDPKFPWFALSDGAVLQNHEWE